MDNLRKDLVVAFQEGNFLQVVYDKSKGEHENRYDDLAAELASIHNDGLLDVIAGFKTLQYKPDVGCDFFLTRHILEKALPKINAPVKPVMECVLHLVKEAGQDLAAGTTFSPFIDFCASEPSRPKESLALIEASIAQFVLLLPYAVAAGARIDAKYYLNEAIRLTGHENIEIRIGAIFSLGIIQYPQGTDLCDTAFACLESSVSKETDDRLLYNLIKSAFIVYKYNKSQVERVCDIINCALSKGGDFALHAASELFGFDFNEIPEILLDALLVHLLRVKPASNRTLDKIDYGLAKLLHRENPIKGIEFLESLLLANVNELSMDIFERVIRKIIENPNNLLNKLMTRWFLKGDRVLCEGISAVVNKDHDHNILLEIDPSALVSIDLAQIIFLSRKAIGYLFSEPVAAASVIISLMHRTNDEDTLQQLSTLLFNPLLLNFPGKVKDFLSQQAEIRAGKVKTSIEKVFKNFDEYFADFESTGVIPELHPSQAHRDAYQRYFSRLMSESFKKAENETVIFHLVSKSVLLYGRSSINYVYERNGNSERTEIPLQCHSTKMEFPRFQHIDPIGLDYMLWIFKAEQMIA